MRSVAFWLMRAARFLPLMAKYQKDDSGSATSFLPHTGTIKPGYLGQRIPSTAS